MGMMGASKLDRQITVLRASLIDDGFSQVLGPFAPVGTIWALRSDVKDAEKAAAGTIMATLTTRFLIRSTEFSRGIKPQDRITSEGMTWEITGVKQASQYGRNQLVELTCEGRTDGA